MVFDRTILARGSCVVCTHISKPINRSPGTDLYALVCGRNPELKGSVLCRSIVKCLLLLDRSGSSLLYSNSDKIKSSPYNLIQYKIRKSVKLFPRKSDSKIAFLYKRN